MANSHKKSLEKIWKQFHFRNTIIKFVAVDKYYKNYLAKTRVPIMKKFSKVVVALLGITLFVSCAQRDNGQLIGVLDRPVW